MVTDWQKNSFWANCKRRCLIRCLAQSGSPNGLKKMSGRLTGSRRLRIRTNARAFALYKRAVRKSDATDV